MNIYNREVKNRLKSAIIWSVSIFLLIVFFMAFYTGFAADETIWEMVLENYPQELLQAMGMTGVNMATVIGYFTMCMLFAQICLAVQASQYGFSSLSEEERDMTADFLLTKPIKRSKVFFSKLFAALTGLIITNAMVWATTFLCLRFFTGDHEYDPAMFVKMLSVLILFQLFFLGVGMVISVSVKKIKSALSYSMGLAFGMYIISTVGSIVGENTLAYITPFKYFELNTLILEGSFDPVMIIICAAVVVVSLTVGYILYNKRNIRTAS